MILMHHISALGEQPVLLGVGEGDIFPEITSLQFWSTPSLCLLCQGYTHPNDIQIEFPAMPSSEATLKDNVLAYDGRISTRTL